MSFLTLFGGAARRRAWTPAALTSLRLWLTAGPTWCFQDAGATTPAGNGDAVYRADDRSDGTNPALQGTAELRPTLTLASGQYHLAYDGAGDQLAADSQARLQCGDEDFTLLAWVYFDARSGDRAVVGKGSGGGAVSDHEYILVDSVGNGGLLWYVGNGADRGVAVRNGITTGAWYLVECYHDAAANEIGCAVNGGAFATGSYSGGCAAGALAFRVGGGSMNGRIAEVILTKSLLSADERQRMLDRGRP